MKIPRSPRPWRSDDVDAALAALLEPETRLWNAGWVQTRDDATVWLERRQDWTGDHASWAVEDAASRVLLGSVSLHSIDLEQSDAEIGYWVHPGARGRGLMTKVCRMAVRHCFIPSDDGGLGLRRLRALAAAQGGARRDPNHRNPDFYRFPGLDLTQCSKPLNKGPP